MISMKIRYFIFLCLLLMILSSVNVIWAIDLSNNTLNDVQEDIPNLTIGDDKYYLGDDVSQLGDSSYNGTVR